MLMRQAPDAASSWMGRGGRWVFQNRGWTCAHLRRADCVHAADGGQGDDPLNGHDSGQVTDRGAV